MCGARSLGRKVEASFERRRSRLTWLWDGGGKLSMCVDFVLSVVAFGVIEVAAGVKVAYSAREAVRLRDLSDGM